jgi:hypothetical protein
MIYMMMQYKEQQIEQRLIGTLVAYAYNIERNTWRRDGSQGELCARVAMP